MLVGDYGGVLVLTMLVSIGLTVCYSVRLIYYLAVGAGYGYRGGAEGDGVSGAGHIGSGAPGAIAELALGALAAI
jgi:hypothetical protein